MTFAEPVGEHALSVRRVKIPRFPLPKGKKRPLRFPTLRGLHVPSFDAPSPSSWCSRVRSRRTVRSGGKDRSWFGCPHAIKKAAGNAATQGTYASKVLNSPATPPSSGSQRCRGCRLRTAKKRRVPNPSPYDASSPHRREQSENDGRNTYESSPSRQNVAGVRQPRKRRVP